MRFVLVLLGVLLLGACAKEQGPNRLNFVGTTRFTSSNRTGLGAADTLASRIYAEDPSGQPLGRLRVTVRYSPRRDPFLYPVPVSALDRDLIDNNPEEFVYLDTLLAKPNDMTFLLTSVFGVRTTTGSERWQYDLLDNSNSVTASRAFQLSMRRPDSLNTYQDYTFRLIIPAVGVPADPLVRSNSTRRFLQLKSGLALPAYTVLRAGEPGEAQRAAQKLTDLIILPDGRTIITPDTSAANFRLDATRWPAANRNATRIYPAPITAVTAASFSNQTTDAGITAIYNQAASQDSLRTRGRLVGPVGLRKVYAFQTGEGRHGLLLVTSIPTSTSTSQTAGLNLQVRMAKITR